MQVLKPDSPFKPRQGKFHVIHLDFAGLKATSGPPGSASVFSLDAAATSLMAMLVDSAQRQHGIDISDAGVDIGRAVELWVMRLNATDKRPIVMLVDEYDSLFIQTLDDPAMAELIAFRVMAPFFGATKLLTTDFHKVFLTGVSKVGMASIFSGVNHFQMLLDNADFCSLYGFTEAELRATYVCIGNG